MVTQWKKQAIESLPDVFSTRRERDAQEEETLKAELYQQIGQLKCVGANEGRICYYKFGHRF